MVLKRKRRVLSRIFSLLISWTVTSRKRRSVIGGILRMPAKNWSYLFFSTRRRSSNSSRSSSGLTAISRLQCRYSATAWAGRMSKTAKAAGDSAAGPPGRGTLRTIPSVETILSSLPFSPIIDRYGRGPAKDQLSAYLAAFRGELTDASPGRHFNIEDCAASLAVSLEALQRPALRKVINGSGVIIH